MSETGGGMWCGGGRSSTCRAMSGSGGTSETGEGRLWSGSGRSGDG